MKFPDLMDRFISYTRINTGADEGSLTFPSTEGQLVLAERLKEELMEMGLSDVSIDGSGYLYAALGSNSTEECPTIALIAHLDTSPDVTGNGVNPQVHRAYDGRDIVLSGDPEMILSVDLNPGLSKKRGETIITTDGTTLLGADDKAGIAEIMSALNYLVNHPDIKRPHIRILFTPDEEIGRSSDRIDIHKMGADYGYTIDGGEAGEIEDETFCADTVRIHIKGVNVHPGYAKDSMINAIKVASMILEGLPKGAVSPETTEGREGYIHPHFMSGTVEEAELKILIRDFAEEGLADKEDLVQSLVHRAARFYPGAEMTFDVERSYRNMKMILKDHPLVADRAEDAIRLSGLVPMRKGIRGGTDGARLCFMGLPTPNLFTGGHNFHSRYEWISLEDMEKATEVIVRLMELWTTGHQSGGTGY